MAESLVHLATFSSPVQAELAVARLEAAGIPVVLDNLRLLVPRSAAEEAAALLESPDGGGEKAAPTAPPAELRCPICGTSQVTREPGSFLARLALLILGQFLPLGDAARTGRRLRCEVCTYRWREGDDADGRVPSIG